MDRGTYLAAWSAGHGDYDPFSSKVVTGWLRAVYHGAEPLASRRVPPHVITATGVALAAAAAAGVPGSASPGAGRLLLVAALVLGSGLADALDGAVALLSDRATTFGFVLDSVADRCSDLLFTLMLWRLGAPAWVAIAAGALTMVHEYVRARAAAGGLSGIGLVTVAERPTRLALAFLAPVVAASFGHAQQVAAAAGWVWVAVGVIGLIQLLASVHARVS